MTEASALPRRNLIAWALDGIGGLLCGLVSGTVIMADLLVLVFAWAEFTFLGLLANILYALTVGASLVFLFKLRRSNDPRRGLVIAAMLLNLGIAIIPPLCFLEFANG